MKVITGLLLENFTTICLVIGLGIITLSNKNLDKRTNLSFVFFILLVLVLNCCDMADFYLSSLPYPTVLRHITSALGYTLRPAAIVILTGILLRRKKSGIFLFWIPIIAIAIISFTSYYTHIMFWFGAHNQFMEGSLRYISHIVSGVYLFVLVILTIKMHRNITPSEIFVVLYIAVICAGATILESVLSGYKFLLTGAMISSCAMYYIILYIETFKCDILTGLMNRRSFYLDAHRMRGKNMVVLSIDLNGLKDINDTNGHSAGDNALQSMGNAMLTQGGKNFFAYRVGGDEFMAIGKEQSAEAAEEYIEAMRKMLKNDGLTASFGYAIYSPFDGFEEVCNQADSKMYEDKRRYKHRTASNTINDKQIENA